MSPLEVIAETLIEHFAAHHPGSLQKPADDFIEFTLCRKPHLTVIAGTYMTLSLVLEGIELEISMDCWPGEPRHTDYRKFDLTDPGSIEKMVAYIESLL